MDQPCKIANSSRGELNQGFFFLPCTRTRLRIWSRESGSPVPSRVILLILHTQAESVNGAYNDVWVLIRTTFSFSPFLFPTESQKIKNVFLSRIELTKSTLLDRETAEFIYATVRFSAWMAIRDTFTNRMDRWVMLKIL